MTVPETYLGNTARKSVGSHALAENEILTMEDNPMTEPNEVELKPCPFCACRSVCVQNEEEHDKDDLVRIFYRIQCNFCCTSTDWYSTKEEARAAWNRRVETAEWTKNLPSMEGFYFAYCNDQIMRVVEVHTNFLVMQCNTGRAMDIGRFIEKYKPLWYKIPTPPLPGKEVNQ